MQLGGRYEVLVKIGEGGMANVYSARDILLNRTVTVKVLKDYLVSDADFVRRFRREAQAAAVLSHPHIVNIFDVGREDEIYFIVMEYIQGKTLKDLIREKGRIPADIAVELLRQITEAIMHAHENGVIHRDIKPQNILVSRSGEVKVTDFGIAQAVTTGTVTYNDQVMGSVHYFSPEQARGNLIGEQSDVYSLGIVLYEMLTGQVPYVGDSPISVALKHLNEQITPPRQLYFDIPEPLELVVLKSVQKNTAARYSTARDLRDDLVLWQQERRVKAEISDVNGNYPEDDMDNTREFTPIQGAARNEYDNANGEQYETAGQTGQNVQSRHSGRGHQHTENHAPSPREEEDNSGAWWKSIWFITSFIMVLVMGTFLGGYHIFRQLIATPDIMVPEVVGLEMQRAEELLSGMGLKSVVDYIYHEEIMKDYVITQHPPPDTRVKEGREVKLEVSQGIEILEIPELVNIPRREAVILLTRMGLEYSYEEEHSDTVPPGYITRQDPRPGVKVRKGEEVLLYISKGTKSFPIRNLFGEGEAAVKAYLDREDLIINRESWVYSNQPPGTVIEQYPPAGSTVQAGDTVDLVWSRGQDPWLPDDNDYQEDDQVDDQDDYQDDYQDDDRDDDRDEIINDEEGNGNGDEDDRNYEGERSSGLLPEQELAEVDQARPGSD